MPLTFDTTETITPTTQRLSARFTPCGKYLITGGFEGLLYRWSLIGDERTELSVIKGHHGWVEAIGFHPTESRVYSGDSWGGLACHDYSEENPTTLWSREFAHDGWLRAITVGADGSWLASCGKDHSVQCWKTKNGKLYWIVEVIDSNNELTKIRCWGVKPEKDRIHLNRPYMARLKYDENWGFSTYAIGKTFKLLG